VRDGFGLIRTQPVRRRDGRPFAFVVRVARTIDGIRSPRVISGVTTFVMHARHAPEETDPDNAGAYWDDLADSAEKDAPVLRSLGIEGAYDDRTKQVVPWEEWIRNCRIRAEVSRQRQREQHEG
jgi:hypothetical protein